ncbi:hypothetical protein BVY11_14490 [Pseudomonas amygdali pv. morsprunorum]|nr:hypothetical protein BVY12_23900 [Pseudomonas amygdali pv. morsprunorum]PPS29898.1 hypothetical protein BVY11_14490 [Pseudomonas amygdali pv. morsprunorum]
MQSYKVLAAVFLNLMFSRPLATLPAGAVMALTLMRILFITKIRMALIRWYGCKMQILILQEGNCWSRPSVFSVI